MADAKRMEVLAALPSSLGLEGIFER